MILNFEELYCRLNTIHKTHPNIYKYWDLYLDEMKQKKQHIHENLSQSIQTLIETSKTIPDVSIDSIITLQMLSLLK